MTERAAGYTRPVEIRIIATVLCASWWVAEYIRSSIRGKASSKNRDKGSAKLWDLAHFFGVIGIITGFTPIGRVRDAGEFIAICGLALMLVGVAVRWLAIYTLGQYFTGRVSILEGQHLVQTGLYRHVRHPAYAGSLLAYLGMGLAVANWISVVLIFFPILLAALYRIRVEEEVLRDTFGQEYAHYSIGRKRLLPGIY